MRIRQLIFTKKVPTDISSLNTFSDRWTVATVGLFLTDQELFLRRQACRTAVILSRLQGKPGKR